MYKLIVTNDAPDYLNDNIDGAGICFSVNDLEEAMEYVRMFVKKQFTVIVEEVTV